MFMHGGFGHIAGNMLYLWIFGNNVENRFGHVWFLIFYLLAGLVGSLGQIALDPSSIIATLDRADSGSGGLVDARLAKRSHPFERPTER